MPSKTSEKVETSPVDLAIGSLGDEIRTLVETVQTRGERMGAMRVWQGLPDGDLLAASLSTLGLPAVDADLLSGFQYVRDLVASQAVGIDITARIDAVASAARPLRGMVDAAPLTGAEVPDLVATAIDWADAAIASAGTVTAAKVAKSPSSTARGQQDRPWESAGDLVRMVVTAPDGTRMTRKASQKASVFSSTKAKYGATLPQLAGTDLAAEYAAAFGGQAQSIQTTSGVFSLVREG